MLVIQNIMVRTFSTDYAHVVWQIEPTAESISDYDFFILRSEGQVGPYTVISGALVDQYIWRDSSARDNRSWRRYYYRVRVTHRISGESAEYGSRTVEEIAEGKDPGGVSRDPRQGLIGKEISYRRRLISTAYAGKLGFIFQSRTFGQRCLGCWDPIKRQPNIEKCSSCYGTTFVGGFHTPIQVYIAEATTDRTDVLTPNGRAQPKTKSFFLASFPEVKPGDMIVESTNERWRIGQVSPSYVMGALVSQIATCARVIKSDIEYKVPIKGVDAIRFEQVGEWHYTGATNLESIVESRNRYEPPEL